MKKILPILLLFISLSFTLSAQQLKRKAFLGVKSQELNDSIAKAQKLPVSQGIFVQEVLPNSTAASLKLKPNDVITGINKQAITNQTQLLSQFQNLRENEPIIMQVQRGKKKLNLKGKAVG